MFLCKNELAGRQNETYRNQKIIYNITGTCSNNCLQKIVSKKKSCFFSCRATKYILCCIIERNLAVVVVVIVGSSSSSRNITDSRTHPLTHTLVTPIISKLEITRRFILSWYYSLYNSPPVSLSLFSLLHHGGCFVHYKYFRICLRHREVTLW